MSGNIVPLALIAGVGLAVVAAEDEAPATAAAQRTRTGSRFSDLPVGELFEFDHGGMSSCLQMAHGPWLKLDRTHYSAVGDSTIHRVGRSSVKVRTDLDCGKRGTRSAADVAEIRRIAATGNPRRAQRTRVEANPAQVRELELWAANTSRLDNQRTSIIKNLVRKKRRGVYDHELAVKLWRYWTDAAAKDYQHEFGGSQIFSPADREAAARTFRDEFEVEYDLGNYDYLVPQPKGRRR